MNFSQRLRYLRDLNDITQEDLAKYLSVGRPTVAGYETKGKQPSFELLCKIADYFDVSIDYLLGRIDIKNPIKKKAKESHLKHSYDIEFFDIEGLSPESKEDLKKYIELLKLKDVHKQRCEVCYKLDNHD